MRWHRIKYPKLLLLLAMLVLAYFLFRNPAYFPFAQHIVSLGAIGAFMAGLLFSYGFTSPFAIVLFILMAPTVPNMILFAMIGGAGALVSDLLIFHVVRFSLKEEVDRLAREPLIRILNHSLSKRVRHYLLPVLGSFIIASPLPDELGVSLLAVSHTISPRIFVVISFVFNSLGILVLLALGKVI